MRATTVNRSLALLGAAAIMVVGLTACGNSKTPPPDTGTKTESGDGTAASLVPKDIRDTGVLKAATAEGYPPMEMYKEGTQDLIGVDPELADLIAKQLDLKLQITNASFPGLIPGLQSKQWNMAISSMSDTAERRKAVDFVDYFTAGGSIMVKKGNPEGIKDIADLCGKAVVAGKGSSNLAILQKYSDEKCDTPMKVSESEDAPTGLLQLDTGRAVGTMVDYPVAKLMASKAGKYEVLEKQYEAGPWGIAIDKKNSELTQAVKKALQELIDNGEYQKLLEKYDVTSAAVKSAETNAGE
ncbi:ABC transporter substrate-binding protein [Leucobacter sp. CSA2]|uniref:ABC transporter substrate-binding protein n=1 Tax=Leucobacter edaphi TaxID=2796472 RepID=A0A934QES8_9MICO|nr:ABC transporter substrate-binding protein [Leucobacter edaphi]MBK0422746.1 ABC transporter substrate-binding protein [Leucobacter edaphi]